ncbi:NADH dehydrogenase FAD-containing subunit [Paramixta manurensis]|uniref:NADH dehydrogenase FAD-containing subunit n=1 Tax=Paramixta manurensis TaxID=2740817 RepID=A0A6M8UES2_9GAMM|nr:NADH dehydrogenase FAD-containing subunit [Erwiniaceae bacterium PD-1]
MSDNIVVVGAGFAGMWAALSASRLAALHKRNDIRVTVIAPQPELSVRPRLYEKKARTLIAPLLPLFEKTNVHFIKGKVVKIDDASHNIYYRDENEDIKAVGFSKLVLASGSQINKTTIKGADTYSFDIDQAESADVFEKHLHALSSEEESQQRNTFIICGGGLTGIELATELPTRAREILGEDADIKVMVIDRGTRVGANFSAEMAGVISEASEKLGVEWLLNKSIEEITKEGVLLTDGTFIKSRTVVLTAGVKASPLTAQLNTPKDNRGRLHVDSALRVAGYEDIYATGDVAYAACDQNGKYALMTCQHAIPMGKFAGNNAAAAIIGLPPLPYRQENYVTCVDLGAWGAVYTETWNQHVKSIQKEAKNIKVSITNQLIYPPEADREIAFEKADPLSAFV